MNIELIVKMYMYITNLHGEPAREYRPAAQLTQLAAVLDPTEEEVPPLQSRHPVFAASEYLAAGQLPQSNFEVAPFPSNPCCDPEPALHATQSVAPVDTFQKGKSYKMMSLLLPE